MIDIHSHALPFVDDGARDFASSLEMISESVSLGVTDLFLTPHYYQNRNYLSQAETNKEIFAKLMETVRENGLKINLHLGNEIFYTIGSLEDLRKKCVIPLGDSNKVLIEFSLDDDHEDLAEAIHNITSLGFVPVIAHPERYPYLTAKHDFEIIRKMGALIQVNAGSVVGRSGRDWQKMTLMMIKHGYADFVASDIHVFRTNLMLEAFQFVKKKFGAETAEKLFNNRSVLS